MIVLVNDPGYTGDPSYIKNILKKRNNMTDFKMIPVEKIQPDPNQPRKIYDETAMTELVQSVKEKGILQPILLRPNGSPDTYILVCGERRYRASKEAGLNEVPAVIRELSDDEALELQIIENLQRKDVHPMEEAVAFKSLLDHKQYTVAEIANRVGKKDFYVKQRLKLNELIKGFQDLFFQNKMTLTDALKIAQFEKNIQEEFYKEEESDYNWGKPNYKFDVNDWQLNKYKGNLSKAPFSLADPTLNPKMGTCTTCKFNSAVACLFPEDAESPRCNFIPCFKTKVDNNFAKSFAEAKEDPTIVFISEAYNSDKDKTVQALKKEGIAVLSRYDEYYSIDAPEKPDWEEYKEEAYDDEPEEDIRKEFEKELADYDKDLAAYEKKVASGKYKKAFVVDGDERGRYIYVELKQKGAQKKAAAAVASDAPSTADIDEEIKRIKDREKRAKELDAEKIYARVQALIKESKVFISDKRDHRLSQEEIVATAVALYECGSSEYKKIFKKQTGVSYDFYSLRPSALEKLSRMTEFGLNALLWPFLLDKLAGNVNFGSHLTNANFAAIYNIAKAYHGSEVSTFELEQQEAAAKREQRVNKRIADLQAQKKELSKPKNEEKKNGKKSPVKKG